MTTNHRPTLESKRGKEESISNTIFHSRALPQHTSLKYRSDIRKPKVDRKVGKRAVEELKRDLLQDEDKLNGNEQSRVIMNGGDGSESVSINSGDSDNEESIINDDNEKNTESVSEYSSSEDESEDETAQLMEELAKIKKERQAEKEKQKLQKSIDSSKTSNPLVQVSDTPLSNNEFKVKKGWRDSTTFRRQHSEPKDDDEKFTNDTLNSDFHQKFLSKYVR